MANSLSLARGDPSASLRQKQFPQDRPKFSQGAGPVAQGVFDARAQFPEGAVQLRDQKQRIIPETARAAIVLDDDAVAAALDDRLDVAAGVGQGGAADI